MLPLPLPMRVSAGFFVKGLSGKIRIHSLPPRLMYRVIVRRAASICLLEIHAGSSACNPYSPKAIVAPDNGCPRMRPRWALRYLECLGAIIGWSPGYNRAWDFGRDDHSAIGFRRPPAHRSGFARRTPSAIKRPGRTPQFCFQSPLREDLPAVDPHLHADPSVRRQRFGNTKVDVCPQGVQRDASLAVPLVAGDLGPGQPPRTGNADAFCPRAEAALHSLLHGPAVGDTPFQLLRDVLGDEQSLQFRPTDFLHVELHLFAGHLIELFLERIDPRPAAPDDDAGPSGVDDHAHLRFAADPRLGAEPFNLHARDARPGQLLFDMGPNRQVLEDEGGHLLGVPPRLPVAHDPDP